MKPSLWILDQWASPDATVGTSKNWLHAGLGERWDVRVIRPRERALERPLAMLRTFRLPVSRWKRTFAAHLESLGKHPKTFRSLSRRYAKTLAALRSRPDAVLQIGALFQPPAIPGAAQASYFDQTVRMAEEGWPDWMPPDFDRVRDEWYALERAVYHSKDVIFTYSERTKRSVCEDYGIDPERVHVVPTACKMPFPDPDEALKARREKRLLYVGTEFARKGGDIVLDAYAELRRRRPDLELVLVGGRPPEGIDLHGARYEGVVGPARLRELYLSSTLLVHPARHDAFPNVLKEAMACGLPAVVSDSCGIPEIVLHGTTGTVLARPDVAALAGEVGRLLERPDELEAMRGQCLLHRERYRPDRCVGIMAEALDRMRGERR